jgi:hypothetical protein
MWQSIEMGIAIHVSAQRSWLGERAQHLPVAKRMGMYFLSARKQEEA